MNERSLTEEHARAALSLLAWGFGERKRLDTAKFIELCDRAGVGRALGISSSFRTPLENLHRLGLLVPLLISPKATNRAIPLPHDSFCPWSWHGHHDDDTGWIEVFYHPYQVILLARIEESLGTKDREALGHETMPGIYDLKPTDDPSERSVFTFATRWKESDILAEFYRSLAYATLGDALEGITVRGRASVRVNPRWKRRPRGGKTVEGNARRHDAWGRWRQSWSKARILRLFDDDLTSIRRFLEHTWRMADWHDPLREWSDLVAFIDWSEREKLRGTAYLGHLAKDMCLVLAALVSQASGEDAWDLVRPGTVGWMTKRLGGPLDRGSVEQREFVCNRFGLNPRPNVVWFVEGQSEEEVLRCISDDAERILDRVGVVLERLDGIGNLKALRHAVEVATKAGARVIVLVDQGDSDVGRHIKSLLQLGVVTAADVLYNAPNLESHNFTDSERSVARKTFFERSGLGHVPLELYAPPKWEVARYLTEQLILPELKSPTPLPPRPIVRHLNAVLAAANEHRHSRRAFHPNIRQRNSNKNKPAAS